MSEAELIDHHDHDEQRKTRKILVAVDPGEESMYALSWCIEHIVKENYNDILVLLYAKPTPIVTTALHGSAYFYSSDVITAMERYGNEVANCVFAKAERICNGSTKAKVELKTGTGDPRDVICEEAEKRKVDMVVMGSHGYGVIKRAFLGSVSSHCAQNLKCPVLIVKKPKSNGSNGSNGSST